MKAIVDAAKAFADTVGLQPIGTQTASITTAYTGGSYTGPGNTYVASVRRTEQQDGSRRPGQRVDHR